MQTQKAWELLEIGWNPSNTATDANGVEVDPASENAVAWSLTGAVDAAYTSLAGWNVARNKIREKIGTKIVFTNLIEEWASAPGRTQKEIVELAKELDI
jgi:hypothetical protein